MNTAEYFKENKYIYLSNVVAKPDAHKLSDYMFGLYDAGKLTKDPQCPLSDSIYGDPMLDNLLQSLAKPLSAQLGIELLPTYTYARIYRPGEELVRHIDRAACEISGTMTLGFDPGSGIWPIFMTDKEDDVIGNSLEISTGDLVMYHGNELYHWRPPYKGQWQVQVFFHFVDANGPHKELANDGRESLGIDKSTTVEVPQETAKTAAVQNAIASSVVSNSVIIKTGDKIFPGAVTYSSEFMKDLAFTPRECSEILAQNQRLYPQKSTVGTGGKGKGKYDPEVRAVDTYSIEYGDDTSWIFEKIAKAIGQANADYYKYDLYGITHGLQLLHYKSTENGHYDWHIDCGDGEASYRKISVSIPLTDRAAYEGGNLMINNNGNEIRATDEQGSISMFPSYLLHQVTPVTSGERWVIVIWINGPRFK